MQTDHYELTMLASAITSVSGNIALADRQCVFELFTRRLPEGWRYGVVAGIERLIDAVERFRFTDAQIDWLTDTGVADEAFAARLADWQFKGTVRTYREGELYFPFSPVVQVEASFADAVLLETVMLSIINHDAAIASKASRIVQAAAGRRVIEMGSRRTHEQAAGSAARAAYLAGFDATSNLGAGMAYNLPTIGTAAHAYSMAHAVAGGEKAAFVAQMRTLGTDTTLLVDTYDTADGIREAVAAANELGESGPGGIRIDSGDLHLEACAARELLDELGAHTTRIVVSSDLDEHTISTLASAPIDGYGVGTKLVSVAPAGFVYKLVGIADDRGQMTSVAKRSSGKRSVGGRKRAFRELSLDGYATTEHVLAGAGIPQAAGRELLEDVIVDGDVVCRRDVHDGRERHRHALDELRPLDRNPAASRTLSGPAVRTNLGRDSN